MAKTIRVLIAKPGLDGHERGALAIALALRDAGMEVVYTGIRQTPEEIVAAAIQEDVDVVGLSCLSGAHRYLFPRVAALMREARRGVVLVGGGIIPEKDARFLEEQGFKAIFGPGSLVTDIVKVIRDSVPTD